MNLLSIGTALGGFMGGYDSAKERQQKQERDKLQQIGMLTDLKNQQQQRQAQGMGFKSLLDGGGMVGPDGGAGGPPGAPDMGMPQAGPSASPGMPPRATPSAAGRDMGGGMDQVLDLIEKRESGGRNIPNYRYDPKHTAQGNFQITNSTWRDVAPKAGVDTSQYPNAMAAPYPVQRTAATKLLETRGTQPWADFNPKLKQDLASMGGGEGGIPPQMQQQAQQTAQQTVRTVDPYVQGRMSLQALAREIEKSNPGADPAVKMMALESLNKLLAPSERAMWQSYAKDNQQQFQLYLKDMQIQSQNERAALSSGDRFELERLREQFRAGESERNRAAAGERQDRGIAAADSRQDKGISAADTRQERGIDAADQRQDRSIGAAGARHDKTLDAAGQRQSGAAWELLFDPKTGQQYRYNRRTLQATTLTGEPYKPQGAQRVGTSAQAAVSPEARSMMSDGIANYQLPPLSSWALKSPEGQATMAEVMKKNPEYDATKYTGKQSGARAMGTRSSNLEMATSVAEEQIPLVQQTSERIDRTQFPTVNSMILAMEKGTGGEDIVRFLEQINTLKYVYARALNPTGVARIQDLERFDNVLNEAWSKGQISAALDQMKQSLAAERRGVNRAMGRPGTEAAPAATPAPAAPSGGEEVIQNGWRYKKQGEQYTPVGPAQ